MKGTSSASSIISGRCNWPAIEIAPLGRVVFGAGSLARLGAESRALGSRALLVTDPGLERVGHPQRAEKSMTDAGMEVFIFDGVKENPTESQVRIGVEVARQHAVDLIVAVGGGSSMDCAKGINFLLTNGGRMADYRGHGKAAKPMLPSIGVPTTAGTGSEAQSYALITDDETHQKMACGDKKCAFHVSILDPEVTVSQPRMVSAVTGLDAIAHAVETLVCTMATPYSRMLSLEAWQFLEPNFERVLSEPLNLDSRAAMQWGAHLAGMAIENAMLGVCHSCANPLTARYGITHGVAIGLLLPHVIRFNATVCKTDYDLLADEAGVPGTEGLAHRLQKLAENAGLPRSLKDAGVDEGTLPIMAREAAQQWTAQFNPRKVLEADLLSLYRTAY